MNLRSLFSGKRGGAPESTATEAIEVKGPPDEEAFLANVFCECAGPWLLGERTVLAQEKGVETFRREVRCQVCGTTTAYVFAAPVGTYNIEEEEEARPHHYIFVHRILPELFFSDPKGFLDVSLGPSGHRRLADLWEEVGEKETSTATMPSSGLKISDIAFEGRRGAIIRFPEAKFAPEGHFAALLEPFEGDAPRFFVLEKTDMTSRSESAGARAVLCEWLEGGRRRNHNRVISPDEATFVEEVGDQLAEERRRVNAGAARSSASWDLAGKEDPLDLMFARNYRLQPCLFAFHLLPEALLKGSAPAADADPSEFEALVESLWRKAADLCAAAGEPPLPVGIRPSAGIRKLPSGEFLIVEMPPAFSAPEPLYVAFKTTNANSIYLVESGGEHPDRVVVTSISSSGPHAILGTLEEVGLNSFLDALSGPDDGPRVSKPEVPNTRTPPGGAVFHPSV